MSLISARQLNAYCVLGSALMKHLALRPFKRRHPERWLARLAEERLAAVPEEAWSLFEGASRCIGCGLCDSVGSPGDAPSRWILGIARQPSDALLMAREADRLEALAPAIHRICPARVQVDHVVALVRANARMLESS